MNNLKLVDVTPDMAHKLLKLNTGNRPLDIRRAFKIAEAINRGEWQLNGDTIRLSQNGVLLDGQHRLKAIEISGKTVQSYLIENLPDDVFKTIDTNARARGAGDVLAIKGEKYYKLLASTCRLFFLYKKHGNPLATNEYPTAQQIEKIIEDHPKIRDAVEIFGSGSSWLTRYVNGSIGSFCYFVFSEKYPEQTKKFFEQLETGAGLNQNSAVLRLRDRLYFDASDKVNTMSKKYRIALIFKAFRFFLENKEVKNLSVRLEGDGAEKDIYSI